MKKNLNGQFSGPTSFPHFSISVKIPGPEDPALVIPRGDQKLALKFPGCWSNGVME